MWKRTFGNSFKTVLLVKQVGCLWILVHWDSSLDFQTMIIHARERFNSVIFREVIIVTMCSIWKHCNNIIFYGGSLYFGSWRKIFMDKMKGVTLRAKPRVKDRINIWLSSLL
ncbi:hypothetical protein HU200_050636 [Digitaria exilis]|uniref:Uncharacterized protein n=1 Tax=Digitaria exilis TaxID=1010633 RepID=A0A835AWY6_9POAL|nr:hypothetical protein HU200_050636 [Digitaria exilis]